MRKERIEDPKLDCQKRPNYQSKQLPRRNWKGRSRLATIQSKGRVTVKGKIGSHFSNHPYPI
jgi:hypothetical protein